MDKLKNITPGEILKEEFLIPMNVSAEKLAEETGISLTSIKSIARGQKSITVDIALRLSYYFGNSVQFWLGIQNDYDIENQLEKNTHIYNKIKSINIAT